LDTNEEDKEEEGELEDDGGGIAWDALVVEDEPAGGDSSLQQVGGAMGLTQWSVGPFPHHVGEGTSQGLTETCPSTNPSQEPTEVGRAANVSDPSKQRESSKRSCFEGMEQGSGGSSPKHPRCPMAPR
jgi:hypothetical protein